MTEIETMADTLIREYEAGGRGSRTYPRRDLAAQVAEIIVGRGYAVEHQNEYVRISSGPND